MLKKTPNIIYFISFSIIIISLFSDYYFEIFAAFFVLILIFILFWQENKPLIILAAMLYQWLSISIGYIYLVFTNVEHKDLLRRYFFAIDNIQTAYWLSIIALIFFSIGIKLALINYKLKQISTELVDKYDTLKVIIFYVLFDLLTGILHNAIRYTIPGLSEPILYFSYLKWAIFFIMIYISFTKNEYRLLVFIIIVIEVIIGFTGYFSSFKDIMIIFPIAYLSFNKLKLKQTLVITFIAIIIFNIGVVWTYVKGDYRVFLSGGERAQTVTVSKTQALEKLYSLAKEFSWEKYEIGLNAMIQRIYYIEYFSATIRNIPDYRPYFNGEIWEKAIQHILMPRMFFPDKKIIDDSKQTYLLTGISVAGMEQGTSISVGFMAESYADFGPVFMFFVIFTLAFTIGFIYKTISNTAYNDLWKRAVIFPMFFIININGVDAIKVTGKVFMFFIVFFLINKFLMHYIDKFLRTKQSDNYAN
ncbi:MAG: hypothetical protein JXR51_10810 [Bacteroidales bacterium]|nr:hypothetical protein [Bacteroidales bacterium]MBN2757658.1 hypothetical protein [Bacteroidales bacterium]